MTWPKVTERPFPSQHLGERHFAELRVSPEAQATYAALVPDSSFSPGSLIVETSIDAKTSARGPVLALERTESDWRYWLLDARGVPQQADTAACAACHAAAPSAPLFGAPRPAAVPAATSSFPAEPATAPAVPPAR
jgi:hypothetical protein